MYETYKARQVNAALHNRHGDLGNSETSDIIRNEDTME